MTEKNGQPSMEEILASIRRIIAEEPAGHGSHGELRGTPIMLRGDSALDDAGDFDLPAIFRSSPPAASEKQTPLLGRLTDAIRGATSAQPETRPLFNGDDDFSRGAPVEGGALSSESPAPNAGLSSLKSVRPSESAPSDPHAASAPAAPVSQSSGGAPASASSAPEGGDAPKRVMSAFKDTHFLRMAAPTGALPSPAPAATPEPAPVVQRTPEPPAGSPVDFRAIVPGQFERVSPTPINPSQFVVTEVPEEPFVVVVPPVAAAPPVAAMPPPPLPSSSAPAPDAVVPAAAQPEGTIEDATADLLRPMLRQWLADNMPRMVEKALHIEIAESVKAPKKP
ncbi:DUF2497 domain-containing protein [Hyphomicrobium sp. LHD-15]|uniref:DUF2497 domain-containing protein n=1 Tax=Hyphomicrobium sp. LHD-15 TaxID=3072142 RepID=UPI00280CA5E9|nr:DUF2497 domain-containing protein [Hyphomicrobium sp. LHD-15]MDQ8700047.1 DUF2497 domain-containing protein [Hyphomicrobium sp. LHD-15]